MEQLKIMGSWKRVLTDLGFVFDVSLVVCTGDFSFYFLHLQGV